MKFSTKNTKYPLKSPPKKHDHHHGNADERRKKVEKRASSPSPPPCRSDVDSIGHKTRSLNKYRRELSAKSQSPCTRCEEGGRGGERASVPRRGPAGSPRGPPMNSGGGGRGGGEDRLRAFPNVSSAIPLRVPFALILIKPFLRTGFPW